MKLFQQRNWGLIIYDEVHLLPAPGISDDRGFTSDKKIRSYGDSCKGGWQEEDVFSLIGPKRFDLPWKVLETRKWIAWHIMYRGTDSAAAAGQACYEAAE